LIKKDLTEMCNTLYMDELAVWVEENQYDYVLVRKDELEELEDSLDCAIEVIEQSGVDYEEAVGYLKGAN